MTPVETRQLRVDAEFLAEAIGPCLILVKCHELLGERNSVGRAVAEAVCRSELERLSQIRAGSFTFTQRSEQYLRAIYALAMAGNTYQARAVWKSLLDDARGEASSAGLIGGEASLRIATALVIVDDGSPLIPGLLAADSPGATVANAWLPCSEGALSELIDELNAEVESAEDAGEIGPSSDGWLYVLVLRLSERLRLAEGA